MGQVVTLQTDGLRQMVAGLGDPNKDKVAGASYYRNSLSDDQLLALYETSFLAAKMVDIPAHDALKKWRNWQAEQDQITQLERLEKSLGLKSELLHGVKLSRLWGGAVLYIGMKDAEPSEPLEPEKVKKDQLSFVRAFSRREVVANDLETDPIAKNYNRPKGYQVAGTDLVDIHPSRLVVLIGKPHLDPHMAQGETRGWGYPVLQSAYEAIRNADTTIASAASLVVEANVDVFGIPDFMARLGEPEYEKKVIERMALAARGKSTVNALLRDANETYDRKAVSFSQLPELMREFLGVVAGAADIPVTRLLGQSPGGLNSTGDGDLENYHDKITSMQTLEIEPAMAVLDEVLIRSTFGTRPDNIWYSWPPLKQMSQEQISKIGKTVAETVDILSRAGTHRAEELRQAATNQLTEIGMFPGLDSLVAESENDKDDLGEGDE